MSTRPSKDRVIGYIILNPNTDEPDWDTGLHLTEESAIASLTDRHSSMCRTDEESTEDLTPWYEVYDIHPILEGCRLDFLEGRR